MFEQLIIRPVAPTDAAAFIDLQKVLASESTFLLPTPEEVENMQEERQAEIFALMETGKSNSNVIVALWENELTGFLGYTYNTMFRAQHIATKIAIGVKSNFHQKGIATHLFAAAEKHWNEKNIHRVEFSVIINNIPAINLYLKLGYFIEGIRKNAVYHNGSFVDEYHLAKLLSSHPS